ncbi:site-specific integrase [Telluribacter sp.]|jgi:site-specific recombinase XerD|uniref:site-specific integrase n=1 Tax=Telluribacter sp. TaxID=1978767 RepID=UPI002E14D275|nr:site-specific integrase [Telluribacter sp.]
MFKDQLVRFKVIFDRKKEVATKGKALVQIEAYQNGKRRYFSTSIYLSRDQWNFKKKEPKDQFTLSQVRSFVTALADYEKEQRYYNKGAFTLKDFDQLADRMNVPKDVSVFSFNQFFKEQLQARKKELRHGTYKNHNACLNTLNEFNQAIRFEDIDYKLIDQFHQFLISKRHKPFTWHKRHIQLKTYLKKAVKLRLLNRSPYEDYKVPTPKADIIPLHMEEVRKLEELAFKPTEKRNERVRDMFLFSVYTGLRWSDVSSLTTANFIETADGLTLRFKSAKESKSGTLPLHIVFDGKAEAIVRKYWPDQEGGKLFKGISNAFANLRLKELATQAAIKKSIHFHIARHTSATIYAQKADVLTAQNILQHSKLSTTQGYLHISNQERDNKLRDVDWK